MNSTETLWSSALTNIATAVQADQFETWFKDVSLADISDQKAVIRVPNAFYGKWFELHYADLIAGALEGEIGQRPEIAFEIAPASKPLAKPKPVSSPSLPTQAPASSPPPKPLGSDLDLNRNYVFSRFITGPSNQLAHAASLAVVESPGLAYNPLFLYGGVGLGKTHLMHAVAHALIKKRPELEVRYFSCEAFMNQFVYALQKGGIERFRARCRQVDVLLIDDIHILANRTRTQEEFFHTFNELYNAHRQIILTSDSAPQDIPTFQDRLISRFKWGLVARIDTPCLETRMAIVRKKADLRGKMLPEDVVRFIAEVVPNNIRELEGAVLKTIGYASLMNRSADIHLAREVLRADGAGPVQGPITCDQVQDVAGAWFGVSVDELKSKSRARSIAFPRQVAMFLIRQMTSKSLQEIGRAFGGRDHSTVVHAIERVERELRDRPEFNDTINALIERIKAS